MPESLNSAAHPFRGVGVALVTPFKDNFSVDFDALGAVVDKVIGGGVDYIVALGTTAETPTLAPDEKKDVLRYIIDHAAARVPIVCGAGGNNTAEVIAQLQEWDMNGVAGLLSVAPYYNKPTPEGVYQHFKAIASATALPIILYNVPGRTVTNILPQTALKLAAEFPHIVAIKEASGNLKQCMEIVSGAPAHFAVLSGDDDLVVPQVSIGMQGVISVAANCFTKDFCAMVHAALGGDYRAARALQYRLMPGIDMLFAEGNPAGVKAALKSQAVCNDVVRLPLVAASAALQEKIRMFSSV